MYKYTHHGVGKLSVLPSLEWIGIQLSWCLSLVQKKLCLHFLTVIDALWKSLFEQNRSPSRFSTWPFFACCAAGSPAAASCGSFCRVSSSLMVYVAMSSSSTCSVTSSLSETVRKGSSLHRGPRKAVTLIPAALQNAGNLIGVHGSLNSC